MGIDTFKSRPGLLLKNLVLNLLFPKYCLGCDREGKYICEKCRIFASEVGSICPVCQKFGFDGKTHLNCQSNYTLNGLTSVWEYQGIIKQAIQIIKYQGLTDIISELMPKEMDILANTYISYVPMYLKREKERGFNLAKLIAEEVGRTSNCQVVSLLEKTIDTKPQVNLDKEQRLKNVKNSVTIKSRPGLLRPGLLSENVVLVDDIFTTGATMRECCKVLKRAGVKKAWGFVLARTV